MSNDISSKRYPPLKIVASWNARRKSDTSKVGWDVTITLSNTKATLHNHDGNEQGPRMSQHTRTHSLVRNHFPPSFASG